MFTLALFVFFLGSVFGVMLWCTWDEIRWRIDAAADEERRRALLQASRRRSEFSDVYDALDAWEVRA